MSEIGDIKKKLKKTYFWNSGVKTYMMMKLGGSDSYYIYKFLLHLRQYEYLIPLKTTFFMKIRRFWNLRQFNKYALKLGFTIADGVLGADVVFYHKGNILINPEARIGAGCKFHGDCCIGVARTGERGAPILGKNVDIGVGARILGNIYIADDITIGANAVVTKSFYEKGITIAGIPARKISS